MCMPLPYLLFALWALWPIAAYPGGKLFAPLVFLIGLFALRSFDFRRLSLPLIIGVTLLIWICLTAFWSPASEAFISGSLAGENLALEASYIRFAFTMLGCFFFARLVLAASPEVLARVSPWIYGGVLIHFVLVGVVAVFREPLLSSQGEFLVLTGQSMGRNANLLGLGLPLLLGGLAFHSQRALIVGGSFLLALAVIFVTLLKGLAPVLGICLGAFALGVLHIGKDKGFRVIFNTLAGAVLFAPALAAGLGAGLSALALNLPVSLQHRVLIWQVALERILERPLTGHGINAVSTWKETYASRPELLEQLTPNMDHMFLIPNHPHNMAIEIWMDTGLVGALLASLLLVLIGRYIPAPSKLSTPVKLASAGLFGAAVSFFAVSYSAWDESYWASVAIILSGVIVLHRKAQKIVA